MRTLTLFILFLFLQFPPCLGQNNENNNDNENLISIGVRDELYSEVLGETRDFFVHVPPTSIYGFKYPVLYLLDGEYHFESMVGIMKANVGSRLIPEMIIVAIPNTDRFRDLTPFHAGDDSNPSGGGEKFTKFIENELIPIVDKKYPTMPHRTLVGHSLGGLMVANTLLQHPHIFQNYLAIDPSISWGGNQFLKEVKLNFDKNNYQNKALYIAVANTINNGNFDKETMSFEEALQDTTTHTLHLRSIIEYAKLAKKNNQLIVDYKYYPTETHGSIPIVAEHHALRFLFSWFKFDRWNEFFAPDPTLSGQELVQLIESHHHKISDKLGYPFLPFEYEMNNLAYMYLGRKDYERALPFLELNLKNYPESANAYDSLGDYYNAISDTENAIKHFSKSMDLGGVDGTKEKLEELQKGKKN